MHCCHASFPRQGIRGCSPFGAKTNWLLNHQSLLWAQLGVFDANHCGISEAHPFGLVLFVALFILLVCETSEITFSKIVGGKVPVCLSYYSFLDRVTSIYFYVFAFISFQIMLYYLHVITLWGLVQFCVFGYVAIVTNVLRVQLFRSSNDCEFSWCSKRLTPPIWTLSAKCVVPSVTIFVKAQRRMIFSVVSNERSLTLTLGSNSSLNYQKGQFDPSTFILG